jgi:dissimilatory sulfite reductase (desulfoviridin) alpha/beta subunit
MEKNIEIFVEMTKEEAWSYAQFLKRVGFNEYRQNAESEEQAYLMIQTGERVRKALADKGIAPR